MAEHIQIGDISPRIQYMGNDTQTQFTYPFPIFTAADIEVYLDQAKQSTGFSVNGAGQSAGGDVTFTTAPASGVLVTLRRRLAIQRTSDFQESGEFRSKVINDELDYLTAALQQVDDDGDRSLRLDATDTPAALTLPDKAARSGKILSFDGSGDPTVSDAIALPASLTGNGLSYTRVNAGESAYEFRTPANVLSDIGAQASDPDLATLAALSTTGIMQRTGAAAYSMLTGSSGVNTVLDENNMASDSETALATQQSIKVYIDNAVANSAIWGDVAYKTASYTVLSTEGGTIFSVDASGGAVNIDLPLISSLTLSSAWTIAVKKTDSSGNAITIRAFNAGDGTDEISGAATHVLSSAGQGVTLIPDADATPDEWTTMPFGPVLGNATVNNYTDTTDYTSGTTTTLTLSTTPLSENNIEVYFDGVTQHHDTFTVAGAVVTFSSAIPTGTNNVEIIVGDTVSIGTPSDATVTGAKLAASMTYTGTWANLGTVTTVDINGGTIDGAAIGGSASAAGTFTTLAAGATTLSGDITYSATTFNVLSDSADGADNSQVNIGAGGAIGGSRGAYLQMHGNEHANTGKILLVSGNVAGADIEMYAGSLALTLAKSDQSATFAGDVIHAGDIYNTVDNSTLTITGGSANILGGRIVLYGDTQAGKARDIEFFGSGTKQLHYDDSASSWDFQANAIATTGTLAAGAGSGFGIAPTDGTLHVHTASAGNVGALSLSDDLIVEGGTHTGISILCPDAKQSSISFGSPGDNRGSFIGWTDSSQIFVMGGTQVGATVQFISDNAIPNLTLSGASGSELATFAGTVNITDALAVTAGTFSVSGVATFSDVVQTESNAVASLPSAATAGGLIYVLDETGGGVLAFSDGTNWRRVQDRAVVS